MAISANILDRADVSSNPIKVLYSSSIKERNIPDRGIRVYQGRNETVENGLVYPSEVLTYKVIKQLYYNQYITGSLLQSTSSWDDNLQSTAASGSLDDDYRYFPTESNATISVMVIPRTVFGEKISRNSWSLTSSYVDLIDDGNGNIIDLKNNKEHVGNILYAQGIVIFTNQDYQSILFDCGIVGTSYILPINNPIVVKDIWMTSQPLFSQASSTWKTA